MSAGVLVAACTSGTEEKAQSTKVVVEGSSLVKGEVFAKEACGATVPTIELVKKELLVAAIEKVR